MKRARLAAFAAVFALGLSADATVSAQPAPPPRPQLVRPPQQGPGAAPPAAQKPAAKPEKAEKAEEMECDGNFDHPDPVNWYQGILGVDNEKAQKGSGLEKLLYRYQNDKNDCDPKNQQPPFLAQAFNFAILAFLIVRFGRKPILDGLARRKKAIMGDIDAAEALRADAESRLKSYEKQFSNIASHRAELEDEYRAQSSTEHKRILAEADEKRARMIKDAELRIEQELRQAQGELLRESIEAAAAAAEDLLKKKVQPSDLERLADDYLAGLGAALSSFAPGGAPTPRAADAKGNRTAGGAA